MHYGHLFKWLGLQIWNLENCCKIWLKLKTIYLPLQQKFRMVSELVLTWFYIISFFLIQVFLVPLYRRNHTFFSCFFFSGTTPLSDNYYKRTCPQSLFWKYLATRNLSYRSNSCNIFNKIRQQKLFDKFLQSKPSQLLSSMFAENHSGDFLLSLYQCC